MSVCVSMFVRVFHSVCICVFVSALFLILSASIVPVELKVCLSLTHSGGSSAYLFIFPESVSLFCLEKRNQKKRKAQMHFLVDPSDTDALFGDKSECQTAGNNGDETLWNHTCYAAYASVSSFQCSCVLGLLAVQISPSNLLQNSASLLR